MNVALTRRLKVPEFLDWAVAQPNGRFELVSGKVVAMAPERALHVIMKVALVRALQDAIADTDLPCVAFGDGLTLKIDEETAREPDALVQCGRPFDPETMLADKPVIVAEVVSPSSAQTDNVDKLAEYFALDSVEHYLIVNPTAKTVTHHARAGNNKILTQILRSGSVRLDPPGIIFSIDAILASIPS
jgi:Uma2 family endonuclease